MEALTPGMENGAVGTTMHEARTRKTRRRGRGEAPVRGHGIMLVFMVGELLFVRNDDVVWLSIIVIYNYPLWYASINIVWWEVCISRPLPLTVPLLLMVH